VTDIAQRFDKVIDPVARTFTTVEGLTNYLKASLQLEVIRQRVKLKGAQGRAWRKAHDYLREGITRGQRLDLDFIGEAVKLADAHLRDSAGAADQDAQARAATTADADADPPDSAKKQSWRERRLAKKVQALEAKVANADGKKTPPSTPAKGGLGGGRAPSGKGTDPAPQCTKCHNCHFGKCLVSRT